MMNYYRTLAWAAASALLFASPCSGQGSRPRSDFVFIVDDSQSMGAEIRNIRDALPAFVQELQLNNVDHRFAVVAFGDEPVLLQDLTDNVALIQAALNSLRTPVRAREAGLEAIRMVLGESPVVLRNGPITFRARSLKNLILITDEDSDQPFYQANRLPGQTTTQPPNPWSVNSDWQREVDNTAAAVQRHRALVNQMVQQPDASTIFQYGAWVYTRLDATGRYDRAATLAALQGGRIDRCLQAQVLAAEGLCRTFDVLDMRRNTTFVRDFFRTKLDETLCPCPHPAAANSYGQGWAGTNGVPGLTTTAAPSICARIGMVLGNSRGLDTPCCLLFSDARADRPTPFGGRLLVDDRSAAFLELGLMVAASSSTLTVQMPCNILQLCGRSTYWQSVLMDPGASQGVAFSQGLELTLGN